MRLTQYSSCQLDTHHHLLKRNPSVHPTVGGSRHSTPVAEVVKSTYTSHFMPCCPKIPHSPWTLHSYVCCPLLAQPVYMYPGYFGKLSHLGWACSCNAFAYIPDNIPDLENSLFASFLIPAHHHMLLDCSRSWILTSPMYCFCCCGGFLCYALSAGIGEVHLEYTVTP